eukprot:6015236-Heterocapsa_arctica.AAC.1
MEPLPDGALMVGKSNHHVLRLQANRRQGLLLIVAVLCLLSAVGPVALLVGTETVLGWRGSRTDIETSAGATGLRLVLIHALLAS